MRAFLLALLLFGILPTAAAQTTARPETSEPSPPPQGLFLRLQPASLPARLVELVTAAIAGMAKEENAVLIGRDPPAPGGAVQGKKSQADYVLSIYIESNRPPEPVGYRMRAELLDPRSGEIGKSEEESCGPCNPSVAAEELGRMERRLWVDMLSRSPALKDARPHAAHGSTGKAWPIVLGVVSIAAVTGLAVGLSVYFGTH
jgi:hypothetical protein